MDSILSFYTWWEPETDQADGMRRSLDSIRSLGFETISYDIQYTWLERDRVGWERVLGACEERSIDVVPVVSYGFLPGAGQLSALTGSSVTRAVDSNGSVTDNVDTHDLGNVDPIVEYLEELLGTYGESLYRTAGRTLLNFWEPSMVEWSSMTRTHLGYGPEVVEGFQNWALGRASLKELNTRWATGFEGPTEITPPREGLWDGKRDIIFVRPDPFWDDWCLYRAEILARFYGELFRRLKASNGVEIALGLSQHGVVTQHDAFHQRCIHLPLWRDVPADKFIVSDDLYCKSPSEVITCMEAELALFRRYFGDRLTAFITPVEGRILVERPSRLYSLCAEFDLEYLYLYAWNEMADGANIRDHEEIWPEIREILEIYG
jgi:hypothetical protein